MAENKFIYNKESKTGQSSPSPAPMSNNPVAETNNSASKGIRTVANICSFLMWIGIIATIIGGVLYLASSGITDSYSNYEKNNAILFSGIGTVLFSYGLVGWFSCFILTKVLDGLAVMVDAAEKYLAK